MKFTVARRDLDAALQVTLPAISSNADLSSHFVFRPHLSDSAKIEVLAYTGRVCAAAPFVAAFDGDERSSFTIEGWRLKKWLDAVDDASVLVFEYKRENGSSETTVTLLNDSTKKQYFPSMDPTHFPYWDKVLEGSQVTATVAGDRLKDALARAKLFTAEDGTKSQGLCVVEVRDGVMISTNKSTLCMVSMPAMKESKIRIHSKDVNAVLAFLSLVKSELVEVLEHDRTFFFRKTDGSYFGETRFHETFPTVGSPPADDQHVWEIPVPELKRALNALSAGASKDDDRLWLSQRDTRLVLKMETSNGKQSTWDLVLASITKKDDAATLPDSIMITVRNLKRLLDAAEGETIKIGANQHKKNGFFRYTMSKFGGTDGAGADQYLVMLVWNK